MNKFVLVTNAYKDENLRLTRQIEEYIEKKGGRASSFLSNTPQGDFVPEELPKDGECILVLGGDGTLIRTATKVKSLQIPLLGVNLGNLGYLCELEENTVYGAIDRLMAGDYMTEERMMLRGHGAEEEASNVALNDVVIHRVGDLSMLSLGVYVNGLPLITYHGDGIIIATPTGSTGYNMSAGGPIVDPRARMLLLTPINAHNLNSRSIVLGADDVIEIVIEGRRQEQDEQAAVSFDGDQFARLTVGDRFVVSRASDVTRICKLSNRSFLELLRKKMETYHG